MIQFISLKGMRVGRTTSRSGEQRLRKQFPGEYPELVELTPGRKAATTEDNDRFNQFLIDRQKAKNAALAAEAEDKEAEDAEAKDTAEGEDPDAEDAEEAQK